MQELVIADIRAHATLVLSDEEGARQEFLKRKNMLSTRQQSDTAFSEVRRRAWKSYFRNGSASKKLNEEKQSELDVDEFISRIKKYVDVRELTRELCLDLIEYITVDGYVGETDKPRNIHIYYKFIDKQFKKSI